MRVLQFGVFPPPDGGVQANVKDIRDYLRRQNIPCGVIHLSRHRQEDRDDVFYPRSSFEVVSRALSFPADIWHFHLGGQITRALLGLYAFGTSVPGRKTVLTFHSGGYPGSDDARRPHPFRDWVFRRFDRVIGVNAQIIQMFTRLGVKREQTRLILPFALPEPPLNVTVPDKIQTFLNAHSPNLLAVCLLTPEYDIPLQIEAMRNVLERYPRCGLTIVGAGESEQQLRDLIASKPYADSILLCGNVPRPITLKIMAGADALVRTTWYDGDAVSVREALHFGVPVIASDNGMRPEGVHLIPPKEIEALVQTIATVIDAPKKPRIMAPATDENLRAVLELYRELV